jgi:hypothetical protein
MIPNYANYENNDKTWTKVIGYNQLAVFKKINNLPEIEVSLHNYHIPYPNK